MSLLVIQLFQELYWLNLYPNKHRSHNKSVIQVYGLKWLKIIKFKTDVKWKCCFAAAFSTEGLSSNPVWTTSPRMKMRKCPFIAKVWVWSIHSWSLSHKPEARPRISRRIKQKLCPGYTCGVETPSWEDAVEMMMMQKNDWVYTYPPSGTVGLVWQRSFQAAQPRSLGAWLEEHGDTRV